MLYGHRNDCAGFARALAELDGWLPSLERAMGPGDAAFITADHGNDPTTPGTDHTREYTPLLVAGPHVRDGVDLGTRATFADLGATLADLFSVTPPRAGTSFLSGLRA
jgi:phosphopentomutase